MKFVAPALDTTAADWFVAGLRGFGQSVLSVVPDGFEAYVRVFHPAHRGGTEVSWAEIAAARGKHVHPGMQFLWISDHERRADDFDGLPDIGSLPHDLGNALVPALRKHTSTPDRCCFALWNGFSGIWQDPALSAVPTFSAPAREYLLFRGDVAGLTERVIPSRDQSFNIAWSDDHVWCVATEIDLQSTYVGCSSACADELLSVRVGEALGISQSTGVDLYSDAFNAPPRPTR